jgi:hypothetical protein
LLNDEIFDIKKVWIARLRNSIRGKHLIEDIVITLRFFLLSIDRDHPSTLSTVRFVVDSCNIDIVIS